MEEKSTSTFKFALMYGLMTGAAVIVLSLVFYVLDLPIDSPIVKWSPYLIFIGGMVYGAHIYKNEFGNGFMTYGKAFGVSYLVAIVAAFITAIYAFIFISYIDPSVITTSLELAEQNMLDQGTLTDAQIDSALEMTGRFMNPTMISIMGFVMNAIILAVIGLVSSIFVKKEEEI